MADEHRVAHDRDLTTHHFSTKGVAVLIRLLDRVEGAELVDAALADAGLPREYVTAESLSVSMEWQRRFQLALAGRLYQMVELPDHRHPFWQLWREGGHAAMSRAELQIMHDVMRAFPAPGLAYLSLPRMMGLYNKVTETHARSVDARTVCLTFEPGKSDHIDPALYWNIYGTLERLPSIWGLPDAELRELEGPFHPDHPSKRLVLEVHFEDPGARRRIQLAVVGVLGGVLGAAAGALLGDPLSTVFGAVAGLCLPWVAFERRWRREAEEGNLQKGKKLQEQVRAQDEHVQKLLDEERKLYRSALANQKLGAYLQSDLVAEIEENPEAVTTVGGRTVDAAVLFADLVGFTPRTESRAPEVVVDELNLYFAHIDPSFAAHGGVIDKRMGDGVMAVFTPESGEGPASVRARAVRCGLDLLRAVEACNEVLAERGSEPFAARVGIAAGPLVQGTMGSKVKYDYTVIGDVVNTAARLEGQARPGHLVVGADVVDELADGGVVPGRLVERRKVRVKGKREVLDVVELLPMDGAQLPR